MPITKLKFETNPSLPPNTAALNAFPPTERCLFSKRAKFEPEIFGLWFNMFLRMVTWAVSDKDSSVFVFFLALTTDEEMLFSVSSNTPKT